MLLYWAKLSKIRQKCNFAGVVLFDISELAELIFAITPVWLDFDEEFEVDALAEEFLDVFARLGTYAFEHCALSADEDAFLAVALYVDYGHDVD